MEHKFWKFAKDGKHLADFSVKNDLKTMVIPTHLTLSQFFNILNQLFFQNEKEIEKNFCNQQILSLLNLVKENETCDKIEFLTAGRFSFVVKICNKVVKIGHPKIIHNIPKTNLIMQCDIRQHIYTPSNKKILLFEVQELGDKDWWQELSEQQVQETIYQLWKSFRKQGIIWFDPKKRNIIKLLKDNKLFWNCSKSQTDKQKGLVEFNKSYDKNTLKKGNFVVVDTDFFLTLKDWKRFLENQNKNYIIYENWRYKTILVYEKRYQLEKQKEVQCEQ